MKLIRLQNKPIYEQLLLEEHLLRHETENYIIVNSGSTPAIVLGISGKAPELVHLDKLPPSIPLIRRFSGGGTVIVDEETVFVTFICNKSLHNFAPYPEPILRWAASMLQTSIPGLELRENDFVIGERKCGGNALYIKKDRWLVHTSFLWNYIPDRMQLLKQPPKTPPYRAGRSHEDFLCRLSSFFPHKENWIEEMIQTFPATSSTAPQVADPNSFSTQFVNARGVDALTC
jgi:lipoate-protein ligase A